MSTKGKKGLSREQATELYQDLQRTMAKMLKNEAEYYNAKGIKVPAGAATKGKAEAVGRLLANDPRARSLRPNNGAKWALALVVVFAMSRVVLSGLEFSGIASASRAEASYIGAASVMPKAPAWQFSKEEIQILTSLDARRSEMEERNKRLDEREQDLNKKDKEFAVRITELRELTEKVSLERDKSDRKRSNQLDQLANVYGSMNPQEAADLMEQLDITIALSLIERMPEKRIGQILALMTPERALAITKMLSGKAK